MRLESLIATPEELSAFHLNGRYFGLNLYIREKQGYLTGLQLYSCHLLPYKYLM